MPTNTANLNLFKYGSTDGARTFNIDEALNANWDKIDEAVAKKYTKAPTGIPELDLDSAVKAALGKARTALQSVTKADVGLGNVDNTSDASKPISNAQAAKFSEVEGALTTHQAEDATNAQKGHVQLVDDVNGNSTSLVPTQNAVKIGIRKGVEQTDYKVNKSGKDSNGIFTTVQYTRKSDNTLAVKSVLSGGTSPQYTTRTITYYGINGTTVEATVTKTLSYDTDGDLLSEV